MFEKYFHIDRADDGRVLFWWRAARDGAPLRLPEGQRLDIVEGQTRLKPVNDFHVRIFDLSKPDDLEEYRRIKDRICNGWYRLHYEERVFIPERGTWKVLLEWLEQYVEPAR